MAGLMDSQYLSLHGIEHLFLLKPGDNSFRGLVEIYGSNFILALSGCNDRCFVAQIGYIRPAEAWSDGCQPSRLLLLT